MSEWIRGVGRDPCPYHKEVLVEWVVQGIFGSVVDADITVKHLLVKVGKQDAWGMIDCPALSKDGTRCQVDIGPCPVKRIIEYFIRKSRSREPPPPPRRQQTA